MNCLHCKRPVVLVPSAAERAKKTGGKAADYTAMFPYHAHCTLELRAQGITNLLQRLRKPS